MGVLGHFQPFSIKFRHFFCEFWQLKFNFSGMLDQTIQKIVLNFPCLKILSKMKFLGYQKFEICGIKNPFYRINILLFVLKRYFFRLKYTSYNKILLKRHFSVPPLYIALIRPKCNFDAKKLFEEERVFGAHTCSPRALQEHKQTLVL